MTPSIVYKCPGQHRGPKGTTYSFKGVKTQEETDSLLNNGWSISLDEAVAIFKGDKPSVKIEVKTEEIEEVKEVESINAVIIEEIKEEPKPTAKKVVKPKPKAKAKPKPKTVKKAD